MKYYYKRKKYLGLSLLLGAFTVAENRSFGFELGMETEDLYQWETDSVVESFSAGETNLVEKRKNLNDIYSTLKANEVLLLKAGQIVFKADYTRNENLPEVYVYKVVNNVSAAETTAVLSDYNSHKKYFNNGRLQKSEISKVISSLEVEVAYNLSLFLWMSEDYTVWNMMTVSGKGADRVFQVDRKLVKSNRVVAIDGVAQIEPFGESDTLIKYYGYIDPGVSVDKKEAVDNVTAVVNQLVAQVEKEKATESDLLKSQLEKMETNIAKFIEAEKKLPKKGTDKRDY